MHVIFIVVLHQESWQSRQGIVRVNLPGTKRQSCQSWKICPRHGLYHGAHGILKNLWLWRLWQSKKKKRSESLLASCKASQSSRYLQLSFGEDLGLPIATMNSAQRGQVTEDPKCLFEGHDGQATWIRISLRKSKETNRIKQHQKWNMCVHSILYILYIYTLYVSLYIYSVCIISSKKKVWI